MIHTVEFEIGERTMTIESGRVAKQANGAVTVRYGDSMILASACASREAVEGQDFMPLSVDYREKAYAAGKIPGGFFKREGRPSEKEILSCRIIDRPIRPMFPEGYTNEVQIIVMVLSHDRQNDPDTLGLIGTAAALAISDIPFPDTLAGVRVGRVNDEFVINPTLAQQEESALNLIMAGTADSITMVEGGAYEVPEEIMVEAMRFGHEHIKLIAAKIDELKAQCGKTKKEVTPKEVNSALIARIDELLGDRIKQMNSIASKDERGDAKFELSKEICTALEAEFPDDLKKIKAYIREKDEAEMRRMIVEESRRLDNRGLDVVRPITCDVSVLPRTHGSALFTRGQTQALVTVTLGTKIDEQRLDELEGESTKSYMLHYNFPPFSVGEVRPMRGVGRREVGHGALAERALNPIIPVGDRSPYTIRIVSDILESDGSSSMASVCGGSLAMMASGVPVKAPVAGIAMGLIKEGEKVIILTDILGDEDHFGDMDFKVTGTADGVTALQMDIKIKGIDLETMRMALEKARVARLHILGEMAKTISQPRSDISQYAPRIITIKINPEKIGDVIGPGGKIIRAIVEETGAKIDIDDDGTVLIASVEAAAGEAARDRVLAIVEEAEIGKEYDGVVRRITDFGAFVEILPGTDGLIHISELAHERVERVEDVLKLGDHVQVKVINIDGDGKVRLSRKALLPEPEGYVAPPPRSGGYGSRPPRSGGHDRRDGGRRPRSRG
ncbi:MAG: polyribonucleotide nucleotidyltransferase [candidate division Zixibacteria bacterium]|nr:polyribonucleotide nucleotidyltransferase [candidate division Zixibacteria bacterium]